MGVFEYEEQNPDSSIDVSDTQDDEEADRLQLSDPDVEMVKVCDTGGNGRTQLRITVPYEVVEEIGLTGSDHVLIKSTENGFLADIIDA